MGSRIADNKECRIRGTNYDVGRASCVVGIEEWGMAGDESLLGVVTIHGGGVPAWPM